MAPFTAPLLFVAAALCGFCPSAAALRTQPGGGAPSQCPCGSPPTPEERCPCLQSLGGPAVASQQVQHAEVRAAVESAEQEAAEHIEAAAASSGQLWLGRISSLRMNESLAAARRTLATAKEAQAQQGAQAMASEAERQRSVLATMEAQATATAAARAQEVTATASTYAQSVAQNAVFGMASAAVANASALSSQAEASRQSAAQLAQEAVAAADAVTQGAQEAMRAAAAVPRARVAEAVVLARSIEANTLMLRDRSGAAENLAEQAAHSTLLNHQLAQVSLTKASTAEAAAQAAHDQAVLNSQRLAALKTRIIAAQETAAEASQSSVGLTTVAPSSGR